MAGGITYLVTFAFVLPVLWMVLLSFEPSDHILNDPTRLSDLSLDNYRTALSTLDLVTMYKNTLILVAVSVPLGLVVSLTAAIAITRMAWRRQALRQASRLYILAGLAVPVFVLLFPVYRLDVWLNIFGTHAALILPYVAVAVPFNVLLLTGFLADFPEEIEQAAIIDGAGLWRISWSVIVPLTRPVLATLAIFNVIYVWNEYPFAVTLINSQAMTTVSLGISQFQGVWSVDYGAMMASATLVLIPQLLVYIAFQRHVVEGMTFGALKG
jgi:raffinose/stachyose/melibiose transport system permease protein